MNDVMNDVMTADVSTVPWSGKSVKDTTSFRTVSPLKPKSKSALKVRSLPFEIHIEYIAYVFYIYNRTTRRLYVCVWVYVCMSMGVCMYVYGCRCVCDR